MHITLTLEPDGFDGDRVEVTITRRTGETLSAALTRVSNAASDALLPLSTVILDRSPEPS